VEGNSVVAEMGGRGEVKVMDVSSQASSKGERKGGLEVAYLGKVYRTGTEGN